MLVNGGVKLSRITMKIEAVLVKVKDGARKARTYESSDPFPHIKNTERASERLLVE
jgi:hypothetical protein